MSIVENIKSLCSEIGISIPKLEKILNLSRGSVYNWDKNSPSIDKLEKVADYFKVSTDYLLGRTAFREATQLIQEKELIGTLTEAIKQWAIERNLNTAEPAKQMLKLGEEYGELCQAIAKNRKKAAVKDAIGDMYVVMTILSMQLGVDIEDCVLAAYDEIKDRKGKMINGVFVKEEDLKGSVLP